MLSGKIKAGSWVLIKPDIAESLGLVGDHPYQVWVAVEEQVAIRLHPGLMRDSVAVNLEHCIATEAPQKRRSRDREEAVYRLRRDMCLVFGSYPSINHERREEARAEACKLLEDADREELQDETPSVFPAKRPKLPWSTTPEHRVWDGNTWVRAAERVEFLRHRALTSGEPGFIVAQQEVKNACQEAPLTLHNLERLQAAGIPPSVGEWVRAYEDAFRVAGARIDMASLSIQSDMANLRVQMATPDLSEAPDDEA
jgi:hypothetical protein